MSETDDIGTRETFELVGRSLRFVWPYRKQIAVKILLSFLGLYVVLFLPWPLKILVDHVVMGLPIDQSPTPYPPYVLPFVDSLEGLTPYEILGVIVGIGMASIVLIGAFGSGAASDQANVSLEQGLDTATQSENEANTSNSRVSGLLGLYEYRYQLRTTHRINHRLRSDIYRQLMSLPLTRFSDASIGDAVYRVMYDTPSISRVCYDILVLPLVNLFAIGAAIWTMQYSFADVPSLVAIAWLAAPLVLVSTLLMTGTTRRRSLASREAGSETTATIEEGMSNIVAVQSLGANDKQRDHFAADSDESFSKFRSYTVMVVLLGLAQGAVLIGLILYVFFDVVDAIVDNRMTAGDYAVLYTYFIQLAASAAGLGAIWFNLQNNVAGMRRVYQALDMTVDADHHGRETPAENLSNVSLEDVSFSYHDGTQALNEVSLSASKGEMIALVGSTGAGKSTLGYALAGFIQADNGKVLFDGRDLGDLSLDYVRQQVAFVFQEPVVFDDTVANNIRIGYSEATDKDIEDAARAAGALSFIEQLPEGFETRLGRSGNTLSVGQKQRVAIARGLVSPAPVLILDEPTAALDPETETALVSALQEERQRRLLLVIAHRLSTIRSADRIVFLEDGRITEIGDHKTLTARPDGHYRRFVDLQRTAGEVLPA